MAGMRGRHTSWLVPTFAITNLGLFVLAMYLNNCPSKSSECLGDHYIGRFAFQPTQENPLLGPASSTLDRMGGLNVKKVVEGKQVWRMLSCMWLHAGVVHVLLNVISLLFVGITLEQEFGFFRIGLVYIIAGIGGNVVSGLFIRDGVSVGASGALFGLLGAMLSELLTNWSTYANKCFALTTLLLVICVNLAMGILPVVNNFAHIGGFITGFLCGFVLLIRPQYAYMRQKYSAPGYYEEKPKSKYKFCQCFLLVISLVILLAGFAFGFWLLMRNVDGNEHCSWCHNLKCVPTPWWDCNGQGKMEEYKCESMTMPGGLLQLKCVSNGNANGKTAMQMLTGDKTTASVQKLCADLCLS